MRWFVAHGILCDVAFARAGFPAQWRGHASAASGFLSRRARRTGDADALEHGLKWHLAIH